MRPEEIKVTRSIGAALTDTEIGGWRVSYIQREFPTRSEANSEADRLRYRPTDAEAKAMSEGRFVDEPLSHSRKRSEGMSGRLTCCYIGEVTKLKCGNDAEWEVWWGETPDDNTLACTRHVGDLLTDATEHRIYPTTATQPGKVK